MKNEQIIEKVIQKIEKELDYIDVAEVMEYSGFSYFHFHRLFQAYVGESVKRYIKRLRLEKAANDIKHTKQNITQVTINAGYNTPSAFNKAFRDFFDCSPSEYKKIKLIQKEYKMIKPIRVESIEPIKVYSVRHIGDYNKIGTAFEKLAKWAYINKIKNKKDLMGKDAFFYAISYDDPNVTECEKLRSDACVSNTDESVELEEGIFKQDIKGGKYAVFLHVGEYAKLKDTYDDMFGYYIKENNIKLRDVPLFEKYLNRDCKRTKRENLKTEIYVPIA